MMSGKHCPPGTLVNVMRGYDTSGGRYVVIDNQLYVITDQVITGVFLATLPWEKFDNAFRKYVDETMFKSFLGPRSSFRSIKNDCKAGIVIATTCRSWGDQADAYAGKLVVTTSDDRFALVGKTL